MFSVVGFSVVVWILGGWILGGRLCSRWSLFSILTVSRGFSQILAVSRDSRSILGGRCSRFSILGGWILDSRLDSPRSFGFSPVVWILVCRFSRFSLVVWILVRILPGRLDSRSDSPWSFGFSVGDIVSLGGGLTRPPGRRVPRAWVAGASAACAETKVQSGRRVNH